MLLYPIFIYKIPKMSFEHKVVKSFKKVKEDTEGIKNELAFALKRIAKLEDLLTKQAISGIVNRERKRK
jgi:hypothetical protein